MKRNQLLVISLAGALLVAIPASQAVWSKAHVPLDRVQICEGGVTKNIKANKLAEKLGAGACRLTTCVFNISPSPGVPSPRDFIFLPGEACDVTDVDGDDFCDATAPPFRDGISAIGITPACTNPF